MDSRWTIDGIDYRHVEAKAVPALIAQGWRPLESYSVLQRPSADAAKMKTERDAA